jgi:hypothetical protein
MFGTVLIVSCRDIEFQARDLGACMIWPLSAFTHQRPLCIISAFYCSSPVLLLLVSIATMTSDSGADFVKYFFYAGNTISKQRKQSLVTLAYATAGDQQLTSK